MSEISDLTNALEKSGLDAECPKCGKSSALSNWLLFDGLKSFPSDAKQKKQEMFQFVFWVMVHLTKALQLNQ